MSCVLSLEDDLSQTASCSGTRDIYVFASGATGTAILTPGFERHRSIYTGRTDRMGHHEIGFVGGFSAPGRLTSLAFRTGSTRPTWLTFRTIRIHQWRVPLRTLRSLILATFEIGEDDRYGSQVAKMIFQYVFIA